MTKKKKPSKPLPPREDGLPSWWTQLEQDAETCKRFSRCEGHSHGLKLKNYDGIMTRRCASDWKQRVKGGRRIPNV